MGNRLCHILKVLYHLLRKGISKQSLLMDLHLLLRYSKNAGKAIADLLTFHHHHHHHAVTGHSQPSTFLLCRSMDPNMAVYVPREVEFSCSNTPAYRTARRKQRRHHKYDAATIAKMFEILNSGISDDNNYAIASPSPAPVWSYGNSPVVVRQLRVTDSPFSIREGEGVDLVNQQAEDFIRRFYDELSRQNRAHQSY